MKMLALMGSPRKGGNTDILTDLILEESAKNGHSGQKVRLYDYDILPCIDCRGCKKGENICVLNDGMKEIYPMMEEADVIIFGTPVYWYGPTAKMKLLVDRMRPFIASRKLQGKKGMIVVPSEEGTSCCGPLTEMFRMSFEYLGMSFAGEVLAKAYEKGDVRDRHEDLDLARRLGSSI